MATFDIKPFAETATRFGWRASLLAKKWSPEIFLGVGLVGGVISAVMASKATLKLDEVLEKQRKTLALVAYTANTEPESVYSSDDKKKDAVVVYTNTALSLLKLYGPAVGLGAFSIACVLASHGVIKGRNAALMSAYKLFEGSVKGYRERVVGKLGEEVEKRLFYDIGEETIEFEEINQETGKPRKVKEKVPTFTNVKMGSPYAKFFDQFSPYWKKNAADLNLWYVRNQQQYANDLLRIRGHLFLNEVYRSLGLPDTSEGAIVGWVSSANETGEGDGFIDFGIFAGDESSRSFVNGYSDSILLDFNVDGIIYDKI